MDHDNKRRENFTSSPHPPLPADTVWADGRGLNVNMTVETAITCVPRAVSLALHPTSVT